MEGELIVNINLCLEVEKHPCLYDITREDHAKRTIAEKAWKEVSAKVGLSVEACKKRWANLRTVYVRRRSNPSKSSGGMKKDYYLNKYMQFLVPYTRITPKNNSPRVPSEQEQFRRNDQPCTSDHSSSETQRKNADEDDSEDGFAYQTAREEDQNADSYYNNQPIISQTCRQQHNKRAISVSEIATALLENAQSKKQKLSVDPENPRRCFLLSLMPEVEELPEAQFKVFKRRALVLLDELYDISHPTTSSSTASYIECNYSDQALTVSDIREHSYGSIVKVEPNSTENQHETE